MKITVYTKHNCVQCDLTKRMLNRNNVEYETINVEDNPEAYAIVTGMGFKSVPVVITDNHKWAGFKNENIKQLIQEYELERSKA